MAVAKQQEEEEAVVVVVVNRNDEQSKEEEFGTNVKNHHHEFLLGTFFEIKDLMLKCDFGIKTTESQSVQNLQMNEMV